MAREGKGKIPKVLKFRVVKSKGRIEGQFLVFIGPKSLGVDLCGIGDHGCIVSGMPQFGGKETYAFPLPRVPPVSIEAPCCSQRPPRAEAFVTSGIHRLTGLGRQMINGSRLIGSAKIGITTLDFFLIHLSKSVEQACLEP